MRKILTTAVLLFSFGANADGLSLSCRTPTGGGVSLWLGSPTPSTSWVSTGNLGYKFSSAGLICNKSHFSLFKNEDIKCVGYERFSGALLEVEVRTDGNVGFANLKVLRGTSGHAELNGMQIQCEMLPN